MHGERAIRLFAGYEPHAVDMPLDPLAVVAVVLLSFDDLERLVRLQTKPVDLLCHFLGHEEYAVVNRREHVLGVSELRVAELALAELEGSLYGDVGLKLDLLEGHISPSALEPR